MVEVEEIELDLGLSIGGCFFREEKSKPEGFHSDLQRGGSVVVDDRQPHDHHKREIQAMEAKKKREHKREREVMEPECQRVWKKEKTDNCVNGVSAWTTPFQVQQSAQQYGTVQYMCWVGNNNKDVGRIDGVNNVADGSSRCSSSAVSDYQTSCREDGGSSDSLSHSTHSLTEPTQLINSSNINMRNQPEQSASSHPMKKSNAHQRNHIVKDSSRTHQCITQSKPMDPKEEEAITNTTTHQKLLLVPNDNSSIRVEMGNSDKPVSVICSSSLPQMPYVSTMGNGPNGKTVNGFLYRYSSKSEVSIVCVCHGSTFSPAEFVQHAGGTDISHPLKHITVIPSAFA